MPTERVLKTRCIFCGRSDMSREHIWAKWTRPYLPPIMSWSSVSTRISRNDTQSERRQRVGDIQNRKVQIVCAKECNGGWMSRLQTRAKPHLLPLMLGTPTAFDTNAQETIALWAAMTVTAAEYFNCVEPAVSKQHRTHLYKKQTVPPNWRIWIAHYKRGDWPGYLVHNAYPIDDDGLLIRTNPAGETLPNTQTTAIVFNELYVLAVSSESDFLERWRPVEPGREKLIQVWPIIQPLWGWPNGTLTDKEADSIAGSFDRMWAEAAKLP